MGHSNGNLWDAFGCPEAVAFVGGGGKTTLSFQILNEGAVAGRKALFTTTTKVRVPEIPHQIDVLVETTVLEEAVRLVGEAFEQGHQRVGLVTGRENSSHGLRAVGIPPLWIEFLCPHVADLCVVEADGSRMLPFKAPHPTEPVLPASLPTSAAVVAVVGLDALGVPLDEDHVCRAEIVIKVAQTTDKVTHVTPCIVGKVMGNRDLWCHQLSNPVPYHIVVNKVVELGKWGKNWYCETWKQRTSSSAVMVASRIGKSTYNFWMPINVQTAKHIYSKDLLKHNMFLRSNLERRGKVALPS